MSIRLSEVRIFTQRWWTYLRWNAVGEPQQSNTLAYSWVVMTITNIVNPTLKHCKPTSCWAGSGHIDLGIKYNKPTGNTQNWQILEGHAMTKRVEIATSFWFVLGIRLNVRHFRHPTLTWSFRRSCGCTCSTRFGLKGPEPHGDGSGQLSAFAQWLADHFAATNVLPTGSKPHLEIWWFWVKWLVAGRLEKETGLTWIKNPFRWQQEIERFLQKTQPQKYPKKHFSPIGW